MEDTADIHEENSILTWKTVYKKNKSLQIIGALSYIALNNLDRVYVNVAEEANLSLLRGGTGKKGFQMILKELENIEFNGATKLSEAIKKRRINNIS